MYCIKCGVKLADTEQQCPLCQTAVYHPDMIREAGESLYPAKQYPAARPKPRFVQMFLTTAAVLPILIVLLCDLQINRRITWSGYVIGAVLTGYVILILPLWFQKPNPVIFVPCGFGAVGLYLLYIDLAVSGGWFISFAFPVTGGLGLIVTAVVTLLRYVRRGKLYIFGGAFTAIGLFMLLTEFLLNMTFGIPHFVGWSLYPLTALVLLGGLLIFLGICRPARQTMERKFFI